jgi:hypothetical protein
MCFVFVCASFITPLREIQATKAAEPTTRKAIEENIRKLKAKLLKVVQEVSISMSICAFQKQL